MSAQQTQSIEHTDVLERSIFHKSSPGRWGVTLPEVGVAESDVQTLLPEAFVRKQSPRLPEVSQLEAVRHFVRLSQLNHCIDTGFYPLGSCTMKYNPKVCDLYGQLQGFTNLHPKTPAHLSQGSLKLVYTLQQLLADITGFDQVSLQPAAGAQGELVGMMMIKAYFEKTGQTQRTEVIIPDSAHGTNPASAAMCGFKVVELRTSQTGGLVSAEKIKSLLSDKTAAVMLTNPNTAGLFETEILEITQAVHDAGGLMYYDGANLNAVVGQVRPAEMGFDVMHINTHKTFATPHGGGGPGSGPVAVNKILEPFLPTPIVAFDDDRYYLQTDRPDSIGRVKVFNGNFEMMARSLTYILAYGAEGLEQLSKDAVLNANYLKEKLRDDYHLAYDRVCKHEFVLTSHKQKEQHPELNQMNTMSIVKRLMDYGFHPPTVYFPLIVHEAMMIEPTETESKETLDRFIEAMKTIAKECQDTPEMILNAPHTTPIQRVDETTAARNPDLNYFSANN
ncbi:MAG: aminomethyl-transferring glycine dehydrogenase subunit GcvPB [Vampirovibrio sp.]|nr:aminomethyl-transferring glycine dehydrogenase subunit GcvPB [Vampirovibrio sp.]